MILIDKVNGNTIGDFQLLVVNQFFQQHVLQVFTNSLTSVRVILRGINKEDTLQREITLNNFIFTETDFIPDSVSNIFGLTTLLNLPKNFLKIAASIENATAISNLSVFLS